MDFWKDKTTREITQIENADAVISAVMEMTSDCICVVDSNERILAISKALVEALGYSSADELSGEDFDGLFVLDSARNPEYPAVNHFANDRDSSAARGGIPGSRRIILEKQVTIDEGFGNTIRIYKVQNPLRNPKTEVTAYKKSSVLDALLNISTALFSKLDLDELLNEILEQISKVIAYDSASISLLDGEAFNIVAAKGFSNPAEIMGLSFAKKISPEIPSPNYQSIVDRKSLRLDNVPVEYPWFIHPKNAIIRSWLVIPLLTRESEIGTLNLDSYKVGSFTAEDQQLGEIFAAQVSIAIDNAMRFAETDKNAKFDALTGLLTRRQLFQQAQRELAQFNPVKHPISMLVLDVDHFKRINDSYGHLAGDMILKSVAEICSNQVRKSDLIGRFGGDEFVIILPNNTIQDAQIAAERIRNAIAENTFSYHGNAISATASIGLATFCDGDDISSVFERADKALLTAKQSGRNRVVVI